MNNDENIKQNKEIRRKLLFIIFLVAIYMLAELIGGLISGSLALLADAGHMLGDFAALSMSYFALHIVLKPASAEKTFGYHRTEIIVALINGVILLGVSGFIMYEGIMRVMSPPEIIAPLMIAIASGGLIINFIGLFILHSYIKSNLNIKGAFFHIIGDTLGSIGAITAGLIIYFYEFYYADIIISFIIAVLIILSGLKLITESSNILLEGTPPHLDVDEIKNTILKIKGVKRVHELHVWSICQHRISLSVHVVSDEPNTQDILCYVDRILREKFDIHHLTIQIEPSNFAEKPCDF